MLVRIESPPSARHLATTFGRDDRGDPINFAYQFRTVRSGVQNYDTIVPSLRGTLKMSRRPSDWRTAGGRCSRRLAVTKLLAAD